MALAATEYEPVIGLEVHAQLSTATKIFCACRAAYGGEANAQTCPVCLGLPGALPVLNREAVAFAIRMILAVGGQVATESILARKNYFYPDLPKGYQISQFASPLGVGGSVTFAVDGRAQTAGLVRIHIEEDAGKSFHPETAGAEPVSHVDLNRCGVPLIEIVGKPEIHTPQAAAAYMHRLRQILTYLEISTGNMEEGALRCDANISLRPKGAVTLGIRTELKNLNSFRAVERALRFEIARQTEILNGGGAVTQETLLWDERQQTACPMRTKEESSDYRYFPDPDLPPLLISREWIAELRDSLPELPDARDRRLRTEYGIPAYDAGVLTGQKALADYFEETVRAGAAAKKASNWIMTGVMRVLKEKNIDIADFPIPAESLAQLIGLIDDGAISGRIAGEVFEEMLLSGRRADAIVSERGLTQITDSGALADLIDGILQAHPDQVASYRAGKYRLLGFFVGEVMKQTGGRAHPGQVNMLLKERLGDPQA